MSAVDNLRYAAASLGMTTQQIMALEQRLEAQALANKDMDIDRLGQYVTAFFQSGVFTPSAHQYIALMEQTSAPSAELAREEG